MREYPENQEEMRDELLALQCDPWMIEELRRNPDYPYWGPHEDYQWIKKVWDPNSPRTFADWSQFKRGFQLGTNPKSLKERSGGEIVNWYFSVQRAMDECPACEGSGYNPETRTLSNDWYNYSSSTGRGWQHALTQDEADALLNEGRLSRMICMETRADLEALVQSNKISREEAEARWEARDRSKDRVSKDGEISNWAVSWRDSVPAQEVNDTHRNGFGHDAINRCICVRARAERLGVWGLCTECEGNGRVPVEPCGRLALTLWVVNLVTGQNYGLEILSLRKEDLSEVYEFIIACGERLAQRLDLGPLRSCEDLRDLSPQESGWCGPDSVLPTSDEHGWRGGVHYKTWKEMRGPRDIDDNLISPEQPGYATMPKAWELDHLNELIGVHFDRQHLWAWIAHPRKGCSRCIQISSFDEEDLAEIRVWVETGRQRALERFACLPK